MKQIHKLKELNRKLEDALKRIVKGADDRSVPYEKIADIANEALDRKGNTK